MEHITLLSSIKKIFKVNIITQLMGLVIVPLLALNYDLEDLGLYAFIFSLSSLLGNLMCFRIENAFFSSTKIEVEKVLPSIVVLAFLILFISAPVIYFIELNVNFIYALYGGVLIALFNVFYSYNVRIGEEKKYNSQKLIRAFLELIAVVVSLLFYFEIEFCVLMVLSTYAIFFFNKIDLNFKLSDYFNFFSSKKSLIFTDLTSTFMFSSYVQAPSLFLASVDLRISGLYFIVYKFCLVPSLMIAQSMGTIFKQYASIEFESKGRIDSTFKNMMVFLVKYWYFFIAFFIGLFFVFGVLDFFKYSGIFEIFLIMFFCMVFRFIHLSYSPLIYVLSMQKSYLFLNAFLFLTTLLAVATSNGNAIFYLIFYSFFSSIIYFSYAIFFFRRIKVKS